MRALVLGLALAGCGAAEPSTQVLKGPSDVDPAVNLEVWAFELEWGHQVTGVAVGFGDVDGALSDGTIGVCSVLPWSRRVTLDTTWWVEADAAGREALVFHELGHCVLDRGHDDSTHEDGRPKSVMASEITLVKWAWSHHRQEYVDELFGRKP